MQVDKEGVGGCSCQDLSDPKHPGRSGTGSAVGTCRPAVFDNDEYWLTATGVFGLDNHRYGQAPCQLGPTY